MDYKIDVSHVVAGMCKSSGGTSRVVADITETLSSINGVNVTLIYQKNECDGQVISLSEKVLCNEVYLKRRMIDRIGITFKEYFSHFVSTNKPSVLHSHGIWLPINHWATYIAKRNRVPLIIQPHGMLEPWAFKHHGLKKKIAMALYQRRDLHAAALIIATSHEEYKNIRNLGFNQPIAIIPNGVKVDTNVEINISTKDTKDNKAVLFLSRIHPKKGLINLIHAWAKLKPEGWRLQIAGPNENGHLEEVMAAAHVAGVASSIDYLGELDSEVKVAAYRNASLFVLPTFSENFGVVVAEALSYGLPVITTKGAPWQDLIKYNCGWWIDIGVEPLIQALGDAMLLDDLERHVMGEHGKNYIQRYNWKDIAQQTAAAYAWVLGVGDKPDFVYLD